ncbi:MAG: Mur ligase family protein, partial [Bacteroidota bacterium]
MKFGLRGIRQLMKGLDHPHRKFQAIHVAGTNGKGSTACMLAAMFTAAGYKTGLYTSPHLLDFRERIRINGKQISEANVTRLVRRLKGDARRFRSTFFEVTTALAFQYFAEKKIDIAIVETGLGGRLDATNVVTPLVSAITGIGLEHTEILGKTIEKITLEKAGIIKRNVPCVSGVDMPNARRILLDVCKNRGSTLMDFGEMKWKLRSSTLDGMVVDLRLRDCSIENLKIDLAGSFQVK